MRHGALPYSSYARKIIIPLIFMINEFFFFVEQIFIKGTFAVTQIFNAARAIIYLKRGLNHKLSGSLTA